MQRLFYLLIICSFAFGDDLIDKFELCKRSDPNLNECLKTNIQKALPILEYGFPDLNIPSMQPMRIPSWIVRKDPSQNIFDQTYTDIKIYNLASSKIQEIESSITDTNFFLRMKMYNPLIKFVSQYDFKDANFLGLDLTGMGTILITDLGNQIDLNLTGEVTKLTDKSILHLTSVILDIDIDDMDVNLNHKHFDWTKDGNDHLNKNSKLLSEILKREYNEMIVDDIKLICAAIFDQVDYEKVFPK